MIYVLMLLTPPPPPKSIYIPLSPTVFTNDLNHSFPIFPLHTYTHDMHTTHSCKIQTFFDKGDAP